MGHPANDDDELDFDLGRLAYAVRLAEDRQVVGIFVADDIEELRYLVDQCCDPAAAEYLRLGSGGVYVGGPTAAKWPARDGIGQDGLSLDIHEDDADALRGAVLDDFWWQGIAVGAWRPLVPEKAPLLPTPHMGS